MKLDWGKPGLSLLILLLVTALAYGFYELKKIGGGGEQAQLPLLAIGGVILLILLLTIVSMVFSLLGLTNKDQAMGLPEGSIRSVIAISLIVLFAILAVFLYDGIKYGTVYEIKNLSDAQRLQFIKDHPAAPNIQSFPNGTATADNQPLYDVTYSSANPASDDFAKQLLVLLGTLMTAITSFYLGAGTATSAASQAASTAMPTLTGIDPTTHSIAKDGVTIHLQVLGNNLNIVTHAKIVRGSLQIVGTNVRSNPTSVTCDIAVSQQTTPPDGPWDVVVDDGGSKSATLQGALTINA